MATKDGKLLVIGCVPNNATAHAGFLAQFETPVELINIADFGAEQQTVRASEVDAVIALENQLELLPDLHQFDNLKAVISFSVGYGNFSADMIPEGCLFVNTYEHQQAVADWAIMAMLMLSRDVNRRDAAFRNQTLRPLFESGGMKLDMCDATVGVIGFGHIGREIVRKSRMFEARCIVTMRSPMSTDAATQAGVERVFAMADLNKMLSECDFVLPAIPASPDVAGLFGKSALEAMKESAFFINIGRAELVDEKALYDALTNNRIAGAALDVWWNEDPAGLETDDPERRKWSSYPFWELDNVIMSPHWSSTSTGMLSRKQAAIAKQVDRLNRGEPLINVIPELSKGIGASK